MQSSRSDAKPSHVHTKLTQSLMLMRKFALVNQKHRGSALRILCKLSACAEILMEELRYLAKTEVGTVSKSGAGFAVPSGQLHDPSPLPSPSFSIRQLAASAASATSAAGGRAAPRRGAAEGGGGARGAEGPGRRLPRGGADAGPGAHLPGPGRRDAEARRGTGQPAVEVSWLEGSLAPSWALQGSQRDSRFVWGRFCISFGVKTGKLERAAPGIECN